MVRWVLIALGFLSIACIGISYFGVPDVDHDSSGDPSETINIGRNIVITSNVEVGPQFYLEPIANRDGDRLLIHTNHSHFWEPGDTSGYLVEKLAIEVKIDGQVRPGPNTFWRNGSVHEVKDENGEVIGSYLSSPMTIVVGVNDLPSGEHILTVLVTTTSHRIIGAEWEFAIGTYPLQSISPDLLPTAEYLLENPQTQLPDFLSRIGTITSKADNFNGHDFASNEGICFFSTSRELEVVIDGDEIAPDKISRGFSDSENAQVCIESAYLANGTHLITVRDADTSEEYTWAFTAQARE